MSVDLGSRIKIARKHASMDQQALATEMGVSVGTISRWERNTHTPSRPELTAIASYTGVSEDWLTSGSGSLAGQWNNNRLEDADPGEPDPIAADGLRLAAAVREALADGNGNVSPDTAQLLAAMAQELYASHLRRKGWSVPGGPLGKAFIQVYHRMITNDPALLHDQKLFDLILALAKDMLR